jgi:hypothetical protein
MHAPLRAPGADRMRHGVQAQSTWRLQRRAPHAPPPLAAIASGMRLRRRQDAGEADLLTYVARRYDAILIAESVARFGYFASEPIETETNACHDSAFALRLELVHAEAGPLRTTSGRANHTERRDRSWAEAVARAAPPSKGPRARRAANTVRAVAERNERGLWRLLVR